MAEPAELAEAEYALVGKVVANAAGLEQLTVLWAATMIAVRRHDEDVERLHDDLWESVFGSGSGEAIKQCRREVAAWPHDYRHAENRAEFIGLIDSVELLFARRHAIVHGVWEREADGSIVAFRATPFRKRNPDAVRIEKVGGTAEQLQELVVQFELTSERVLQSYLDIRDGLPTRS